MNGGVMPHLFFYRSKRREDTVPYLNTPMPLKYLCLKRFSLNREVIVTFPYTVPHQEAMKELGRDSVGLVSAGFIQFDEDTGEPFCYGYSEGTRKAAREEQDTKIYKEQVGWKD